MTRSQVAWGAAAGVILVAALAVAFALVLNGDAEPSADEQPTPTITASPPSSPTPSPTLNPALLDERLTVLFIGLDSNEARAEAGAGVNTDTLMLVSVSPDRSELTMISLPRDTVDIPMPDGSTWENKVNAMYVERDVETLVGAMQELFGVPIDGYAQVDMDDLVDLVDAVGGVTVNPDEALVDPKVDLVMSPGEQEIDGATALSYVRTRVDTDYGRAARQQEVVLELVQRLVSPETDVDVASLLSGLRSFDTSLPLDDLPTLLEIARRTEGAHVTRQVLEPPEFITFEGDRGDGRGYILIPDVQAIRDFAAETIGSD